MKSRVIYGLFLISFLIGCVNSVYASPEILIGTAQGVAETTVSIPVDLDTDGNSVHLQFDIAYDASVLTPGSPGGGDALADHAVDSNVIGAGQLRIVVYSLSNSPLLTGRLVGLPFAIATNATPGTYPLAISGVIISGSNGREIVATRLEDGSITIPQPVAPIDIPNLGLPGYLLLAVLLGWTAMLGLRRRKAIGHRITTLFYMLNSMLLILGSFAALAVLPGDSDNDGDIDNDDVLLTVSVILERSSAPGNPDCNQDTMINVLDLPCQIVAADNSAPMLVAPGDREILVGSSFTSRLFAIDPDPGDVLSFSLPSGPTGLTCNAVTGDLLWTPAPVDLGSHSVTVRVEDLKGASDTETFSIDVVQEVVSAITNSAPDLSPLADEVLDPGESLSVQAIATDPDPGDVLTYSLPRSPAGMVIDAMTGLIQWTPGPDQAGAHDVTVMVTDSGGLSDAEAFIISVTSRNSAPVAIDDVYIARLGETLAIPAPGVLENDTDPEGDTLQATLVQGPDKGTLNLNPDGSFEYNATAPQVVDNIQEVNQAMWLRPYKRASDIMPGYEYSWGADGDLSTSWLADDPDPSFTYYMNFDGELRPTVKELRLYGNRGALADGHDIYSGRFRLLDINNALLFESVELDLAPPDRDIRFPIPGGSVSDVYRVEFVFSNFEGTEPGFAELEVISDQEVLDVEKEWGFASSAMDPLKVHVVSIPLVGDINNDGVPDIVFVTYDHGATNTGILRAVSGNDGGEIFAADNLAGDALTNDALHYSASIAMGDIDLDGYPEILGIYGTYIKAFQYDIANDEIVREWTSEAIPNPRDGGVSIADIDVDGIPEIIVGSRYELTVLNNDGSIRWQMPVYNGSYRYKFPFATDLDLDGVPEILSGQMAYTPDGAMHWPLPDPALGDGLNAVGNFDNDPYPEVVLVTGYLGYPAVYLLEHDGSIIWGPVLGDGSIAPPTVADFDGDGLPEIGLSGRQRYQVVDTDGTVLWKRKIQDITSEHTGSSVFDLDGDGSAEVVFSDELDLIIFRGSDGAILFRTPIGSGTRWEYPVVADVDADGHAEIVAVQNAQFDGKDGIHVFSGPDNDWVPTRKVWNQHAYHITNVNDDLTIPVIQQFNWLISGMNNFRTNIPYLNEDGSEDQFTYKADDGSLESNEATVYIEIQPANVAPVIVSIPQTNATIGFNYNYWAVAQDPDNDPLTWSLIDVPPNMTIDPLIGRINWVPANADLGDHPVIVSVSDNKGGVAIQSYTLTVSGPVTVPDVIGETQASAEALTLSAGLATGEITQGHHATIAAGLVAHQSLPANSVAEPGSMLDLVLSLGPAPEDVDDDGDGFTENQGDCNDADDSVHPGAADPAGDGIDQDCNGIDGDLAISEILVEPGTSTVLVGQAVQHSATAIFVDGTSQNFGGLVIWSSSAPGTGSVDTGGLVTALNPGTVSIQATFDGQTGTASFTAYAVVADGLPPVAEITAPIADSTITAPVEIMGTASDDNFLKYTLAMSPAGEQEFTTLFSSLAPVVDGVLGEFDPTMLINDLYTLRLTVFDKGGNTSIIEATYQVDGDLKVGLFSLSFNDLEIPMAGIPITVVRTYDSRNKHKGDFGIGWNLTVQTLQLRTNRIFGTGWQVFKSGITYQMFPSDMHKVSITLPNGKVEEFDMTISPNPSLIVPFTSVNADFAPRPGTRGTLECLDDTALLVVGSQPGEVTLTDFSANTFDPQNFRYTDLSGIQYVINTSEGVKSVTEQNGNTITFGTGGITHSAGKSVVLSRDSQGRISTLTAPDGNQQTYKYDANGDLHSHTDRENNTTRFFYNHRHGLLRIEDPLGRQVARNEYDADGRLVAVIDGDGNRVEYTHDINARQEVETDRAGGITVYHYDDQGNVLSEIDPLGNVTSYTYDAQGNQLSQTNALGHTTSYSYDANGYETSKVNPLGNTTVYSRSTNGVLVSLTDPNGGIATGTYDGTGNQTSKTDPAGNTITSSYDGNGNAVLSTDCQGRVTAFEYDSFGNVIKRTNALGHITTYTYDANGNRLTETKSRTGDSGVVNMTTLMEYDNLDRLVKTTDANGNVDRIEYALNGKRSATVDKNGNRTTFEYDVLGNLVKVTFADGNSLLNSYDANGNKISYTDQSGRVTVYEYDALNRNTRIVNPDGSNKTFEYDAVGQLVASTDENGNRSTFGYDAAGRRNRTTDPLGNATHTTYDANGNVVAVTDANGQVTSFDYDANNRQIRTVYPDGTFATVTYAGSCSESIQSETDQAGNTTTYEHDAIGQLTAITDALGSRTSYGYDEVGNRITETDANGNMTTWSYDDTGHVVKHVLTLGMVERFSYDPNGNVITQTDFSGVEKFFTYDNLNRLVRKDFADGSFEQNQYAADGQRDMVTDTRGATIYSYDVRGRLSNVMYPDGSSIAYSYDGVGNKLSVTTSAGATINTYDTLNRLQTVTAPDSGITAYSYDDVGNRSSVTYPNGSKTTYTYDALNRLVQLVNTKSDTTVISGYTYTLGPAGNRVRVVEDSGRAVDYTYDAVYRLIMEDISDPGRNDTITYSYDPVGNRLSKSDNSGTTLYLYDGNNQMLNAGSVFYYYDANGNRIGKSDGTINTSYEFDYENHMTAAQSSGQLIAYEYDADGIRVKSSLNGVVTKYLVDKNRPYAQVLEERDFLDTLIVSYVYGDDLISQHRNLSQSYYIYDGSGSTRQLISFLETVTDTYNYDAFGVELNRSGNTTNRYLYSGEQYDSNVGFYYLRARYYDHQSGRFTSRDPFGGSIYDPVSLHKYLYANANPVMYTDPSGMITLADKIIVFSIINVVMPTLTAATAGTFWLFAQRVVVWDGWTFSATAGQGVGAGGISVGLKSECSQIKQGQFKRGIGTYFLFIFGFTLNVPLAPASAVYGEVSLATPGFWGPDPLTMVGLVTWWSATAAVPGVSSYADRRGNDSTTRALGASGTVYIMGQGFGELAWGPVLGLSIGLDFMHGFSIPIIWDQFECWPIETEPNEKLRP